MSEFDKIIGYEDIKIELTRFADVLKNPEKYSKLGVTIPSGILLYGAPGVGKTLMSNCFIAETGCKVYTIRKDKPDGDFVNHIKKTFEDAKNDLERVTIVFLDDLDKFANEDAMHQNAEEYVAVQSCIDDCKGHGVFVLATVNDRFCLPDSLIRPGRFDKEILVDTPNKKEAEMIITHFLKQKKIIGNIDTEELFRIMQGWSCANLENVINEAGIYAGFAGKKKIEQSDLIKACMRMIFNAPECISQDDEVNTERVAVHEAGHAVISEILDAGSVSLVSVCRYAGSTHGIVKTQESDNYHMLKESKEHVIIMKMGGKAATEIVYGIQDIGCTFDVGQAYGIIEQLVDDNCTLGFDTYMTGNSSQYTLEKRDRIVASELSRYYQMAKQIIAENRAFIDAVIAALVDHKTITYREMQRIREKYL